MNSSGFDDKFGPADKFLVDMQRTAEIHQPREIKQNLFRNKVIGEKSETCLFTIGINIHGLQRIPEESGS